MSKMRLFQSVFFVGYFAYEFAIRGAYPIPLDLLFVTVYLATWLFESENSRGFALVNASFLGLSFVYVLGSLMNPDASQLEQFEQYSKHNLLYDYVVSESADGGIPDSYIGSSRLLSEMQYRGFKLTPPRTIELDVVVYD